MFFFLSIKCQENYKDTSTKHSCCHLKTFICNVQFIYNIHDVCIEVNNSHIALKWQNHFLKGVHFKRATFRNRIQFIL